MKRTERGESTRERLLEAAREEIIEGGGGMELAAVARRAKVSPGLPYRYFASKSALLVAVVEAFYDALDEECYKPTFAEVSEDWWVCEQHRVRKMVDFFYRDRLGPFIVAQIAGDAAVVESQQRRLRRQLHGASVNVKKGKALGRVPEHIDEELCAALLMGGVYQAINFALRQEPVLAQTRVAEQLVSFMSNVLELEKHDGSSEAD